MNEDKRKVLDFLERNKVTGFGVTWGPEARNDPDAAMKELARVMERLERGEYTELAPFNDSVRQEL